jgi:hypothetical protein
MILKLFIIIIIITIPFMQGIYTYIPETNNVPKEYNVAAILSLLSMVPILLLLLLTVSHYVHCCQAPGIHALNQVSSRGLYQGILK